MRTTNLTLVLATLISVGPLRADVFTDNFDDGFLDPDFWQISMNELGTISENDGVLAFTVDAGPPSSRLNAKLKCQIAGDFDVSVDYDWLTTDNRPFARAGLGIAGVGSLYYIQHENNDTYIFHNPNGSCFSYPNPPETGRLRFQRIGSDLLSYIWLADEWSYFATQSITTENVTVRLNVHNDDSITPSAYPPVSAHMDNFHLSAEEIVYLTSIPGDLNGDGFVDSADLDIVREHWNETVTAGDLAMGDATGDGFVGSGDLDTVRANWGESLFAATVPEPGVLSLLAMGLFCLAGRFRRS